MKPLILLFTSATLILMASAGEETCLNRTVLEIDDIGPDFSHVDLAPSFNRARQEEITNWWQASCPDFREQNVPRYREDNLICRIEGQSQTTLVIGAHFDKVSVGRGVADNWSGVVLIDALMNYFKALNPRYTLEFVAFAAEEEGLHGSREYVKRIDAPIVAMINLDTIGLTDLIVSSGSDERLTCQVKAIAAALDFPVDERRWKNISSDWLRFQDKDIPAVGLHSVNRQTLRRIHHRRDKAGNVSLDHMANAYNLSVELIQQQLSSSDPMP